MTKRKFSNLVTSSTEVIQAPQVSTLDPEVERRFDEEFSYHNAPVRCTDEHGYAISPVPMKDEIKHFLATEIERAVREREAGIKKILASVPWLKPEVEGDLEFTAFLYYEALKDINRYLSPTPKEVQGE